MKRILFIFFLLPCVANAQVITSVKVGFNLTNLIEKIDGETRPHDFIVRWNGGVGFDIPFDTKWCFHTGLYYEGKGTGSGKIFGGGRDSIRIYLNYIELPAMIRYYFESGRNNYFDIAAGIYGGYGFLGKIVYAGSPELTKKHIHRKEGYYKRFDMGFAISPSYSFGRKYSVKLHYSHSLLNISRNNKEKNQLLGLSVCIYLLKKIPSGTPKF